MEGVLTEINDPKIVLESLTNYGSYLSKKSEEKQAAVATEVAPKPIEVVQPASSTSAYNDYSDLTRETFVNRMIESPVERGNVARHAKKLGINPRTAKRWWDYYLETGEVSYKKSKKKKCRST